MNQIWSFVLTAIGLTGFFLAGKKIWWSWYINIFNQILWLTYAWVTGQLGFWIGAIVYLSLFIKNARDWTREHYSKKDLARRKRISYVQLSPTDPPKRGRGRCWFCGVSEEYWCKDNCPLIDPYDYR